MVLILGKTPPGFTLKVIIMPRFWLNLNIALHRLDLSATADSTWHLPTHSVLGHKTDHKLVITMMNGDC